MDIILKNYGLNFLMSKIKLNDVKKYFKQNGDFFKPIGKPYVVLFFPNTLRSTNDYYICDVEVITLYNNNIDNIDIYFTLPDIIKNFKPITQEEYLEYKK